MSTPSEADKKAAASFEKGAARARKEREERRKVHDLSSLVARPVDDEKLASLRDPR